MFTNLRVVCVELFPAMIDLWPVHGPPRTMLSLRSMLMCSISFITRLKSHLGLHYVNVEVLTLPCSYCCSTIIVQLKNIFFLFCIREVFQHRYENGKEAGME